MRNVLLVNDHLEILNRTAIMLEQLGWEVYVATTETLAFESCCARRPNFVIVDVEMSGGAGFESISTTRKLFPDLFVVAVTRGGHKELWPKVATACGANRYIVGPVSSPKLIATIDSGLADELIYQ